MSEKLWKRLLEYTALRYMGDCKCGACQLVPRDDLLNSIDTIKRQTAILREIDRLSQDGSMPIYHAITRMGELARSTFEDAP